MSIVIFTEGLAYDVAEDKGTEGYIWGVVPIGPTDGWTQALFFSKKDAEEWASRYDHAEGVVVKKHYFMCVRPSQ